MLLCGFSKDFMMALINLIHKSFELAKKNCEKKEIISMLIVRITMEGYTSMLFEIGVSIIGSAANSRGCYSSYIFLLTHLMQLVFFFTPKSIRKPQQQQPTNCLSVLRISSKTSVRGAFSFNFVFLKAFNFTKKKRKPFLLNVSTRLLFSIY